MRFLFLAPASQPTKQSTTTRTSEPGRTVKPVNLVLGFVLALVALVTALAIFYLVAGTRINREIGKVSTIEGLSLCEVVVGTQGTEEQDAGITHVAFVGDSAGPPDGPPDGSTNVAATDPVVKVTENDDFADEATSF